jgi:hypothetical protein
MAGMNAQIKKLIWPGYLNAIRSSHSDGLEILSAHDGAVAALTSGVASFSLYNRNPAKTFSRLSARYDSCLTSVNSP